MNKLKKAGYVSLEVIIISGIILLAGLIMIIKFKLSGKNAATESTNKINETLGS